MPKRVKGPTDHVVVVGAGLAGLSAALRLAGAGRKVTVIPISIKYKQEGVRIRVKRMPRPEHSSRE